MNFKKLAIGIMAFGLFIFIVGGVELLSTMPLKYEPKPNTDIRNVVSEQADLFLINLERSERSHQVQGRLPIGTVLIIVGLIIFFSAKKK